MSIPEDNLPDSLKKNAYHPTPFVFAWKKSYLEKLFDEFLLNNLAIKGFEVWILEDEVVSKTIPLQNGQIEVFFYKFSKEKAEEWFDFVERSIKETVNVINELNLEKTVRLDLISKIWYYFDIEEAS
jgi:hypothetical protein